jgi:hypothetical protein
MLEKLCVTSSATSVADILPALSPGSLSYPGLETKALPGLATRQNPIARKIQARFYRLASFLQKMPLHLIPVGFLFPAQGSFAALGYAQKTNPAPEGQSMLATLKQNGPPNVTRYRIF